MKNELISISKYMNYDFAKRYDKIQPYLNVEDIIMNDVFSLNIDSVLSLIGYKVNRINESTIIIKKKEV